MFLVYSVIFIVYTDNVNSVDLYIGLKETGIVFECQVMYIFLLEITFLSYCTDELLIFMNLKCLDKTLLSYPFFIWVALYVCVRVL